MSEWCAPDFEPLVLVEGSGALLRDSEGREYIDGNSSIWTNLHGHRHPKIDAAIRAQLDRMAHTSSLGFTNPPAIRLAEELVALFPKDTLTRVFYSDNGSTAIEVALKNGGAILAVARAARTDKFHRVHQRLPRGYHGRGEPGRCEAVPRALCSVAVSSDACFRHRRGEQGRPMSDTVAAVVIEPLIQGAAGMRHTGRGDARGIAALVRRAWRFADRGRNHDRVLRAHGNDASRASRKTSCPISSPWRRG